ncbi:sulfatase [Vallitalea guaymasensis]|uniref:sulfatase family protein n=1 Tax=Vallitalea guaymasensis TaxID=1185412 RepID=UPI002354257B|nr:sulfatase [Vallitalea guaymasensis]
MAKKNLLYIFADQWRKIAVGIEGQDKIITPNMDRFATESKVFDNAISTYPLCSPHRAALMTGKYPYSCGMWTNCKIGLDETVMLKPQEETIGKTLKRNGYETAYIGKWHLDASELNFNKNPESGAINWDAYTPEGERRQGFDYWFSYGAMDKHLNPHYWRNTPMKIEPGKWSPEVETDVALDYLENRDKNKPFCMFVSWNPPHPPYDKVPEKYVDMYDDIPLRENVPKEMREDKEYLRTIKEYFAAVTGLDENFKRILDYLKENNLEEDTIVVLSADHGDMMGSQGIYGKNIWYEESINIPFMIRGEGIEPGRTDCLFSSIDHMPTLLDLLEVDIPAAVQGQSFKDIIEDKKMDEPDTVFLSMIPGMAELIEPYRKRGLNNKSFGWRGIRTKKHTYVIDNGTHPDEKQKRYLYDNENDPYQLNPVILSSEDERCIEYDEYLKGYLKEIKDPFLMKGLDNNV